MDTAIFYIRYLSICPFSSLQGIWEPALHIEQDYEVFTPVIMEAAQNHSSGWRPRKSGGVPQTKPQGLQTRNVNRVILVYVLRHPKPGILMSEFKRKQMSQCSSTILSIQALNRLQDAS